MTAAVPLPGTGPRRDCRGGCGRRDTGDIRRFLGVDESVRPGFSAVRAEVSITGPESPERYQQLAAAVDEHCPVLDLFRNPGPVDRTVTVH